MRLITIPPIICLVEAAGFLFFESNTLGIKFSTFQICRRIGITVLLGSLLWIYAAIIIKSFKNMEIHKEGISGFKLYRICAGDIGTKLLGGVWAWLYLVTLAASGIIYDIPIQENILPSNRLFLVFCTGLFFVLCLGFLMGNLIFICVSVLNKIFDKRGKNETAG